MEQAKMALLVAHRLVISEISVQTPPGANLYEQIFLLFTSCTINSAWYIESLWPLYMQLIGELLVGFYLLLRRGHLLSLLTLV